MNFSDRNRLQSSAEFLLHVADRLRDALDRFSPDGGDADDEITAEWLGNAYRMNSDGVIDVKYPIALHWGDDRVLTLYIEDDYGDREGVPLPHISNKGDFRNLATALGYEGAIR